MLVEFVANKACKGPFHFFFVYIIDSHFTQGKGLHKSTMVIREYIFFLKIKRHIKIMLLDNQKQTIVHKIPNGFILLLIYQCTIP